MNGIDTGYFEYILKTHATFDEADEVRATVALRSALNHSMEMMFSLLGALLQAPKYTYAWMALCKNNQLKNILKKIGRYDKEIHHQLVIEDVSWESLSKIVFHGIQFEGNENTPLLFSELWGGLANDFCDENKTKEYNSIKHGLRINSGGFSFSIGIEEEYGVAAPEEAMSTLHSSKFGSSFIKLVPCNADRPNRSLISKEVSLSWEIENIITQLQLIIMSIKNITLRLKRINNCKTEENFIKPVDNEIFSKAWGVVPGIDNLERQVTTSGRQPMTTTKKQLLEMLEKSKQI